MLFNSFIFIFLYLPVVITGFFILAGVSRAFAAGWLALASLFFYGYWNPAYVGLLLMSIVFNYLIGVSIAHAVKQQKQKKKKQILTFAVSVNIALLAYYKYANFFVSNVNIITGTEWNIGSIVLPLGISFFTFTQIAFLVDSYQGKVKEYNFIHYLLFVTYFPHLIAGPVLHHKQMMPQFDLKATYKISCENLAIGTAFFSIGLAKKVLLADSLAEYATPVFQAADNGVQIQFFGAWVGALAYTFQLYFDFSGYSDMAIGISRMFGVTLPINFNSPYKAKNIIEFWRSWHITLSQFLREYLYFPLGGNRKGPIQRYINLLITMLLGGFWHGANWTFVVWGGLHGIYLCINHAWANIFKNTPEHLNRFKQIVSMLLTFLAVVFGWVFFKASTISAAITVIKGMIGLNGISLPMSFAFLDKWINSTDLGIRYIGLFPNMSMPLEITTLIFWFTLSFFIIWGLPNSQEFLDGRGLKSKPIPQIIYMGILLGALFSLSLMSFDRISEFLYFQF